MYGQTTSAENHFASASSGGVVVIKPDSSGWPYNMCLSKKVNTDAFRNASF
jgi:hypothetical protein